ncbi:hypothetical protein QR680_007327 [Steinernema hermaphroditum]|uniref:Uncharacterized protein n=1 Tax=Steinernema hermaphroditum TaxID=289476 RepID=A0AA39IEA6_9BILA|nr:hypothetical protein QR680_007327 [Steinernema hermaphroditum]
MYQAYLREFQQQRRRRNIIILLVALLVITLLGCLIAVLLIITSAARDSNQIYNHVLSQRTLPSTQASTRGELRKPLAVFSNLIGASQKSGNLGSSTRTEQVASDLTTSTIRVLKSTRINYTSTPSHP